MQVMSYIYPDNPINGGSPIEHRCDISTKKPGGGLSEQNFPIELQVGDTLCAKIFLYEKSRQGVRKSSCRPIRCYTYITVTNDLP